MTCPSTDELLEFLDDRADGGRFLALRSHLETCVHCRDLVLALAPSMSTITSPRAPFAIGAAAHHGNAEHPSTDGTDAAAALPLVDPATFELGAELARGGKGRIIEARDTRVGRQVALKLLRDPRSRPDRARFAREALLASRLEHPAIVPVYQVGRLPGDEPFLAMRLLRGFSLRDAIASRKTLKERLELLPNVLAIADAMAYAHSQGIIHRDLKPANVLVGRFGETAVIDWGLAKDLTAAVDERAQSAVAAVNEGCETEHGTVLGTPAYMPPEQASGQAVDERADVYALGALLYHVIAGAPPYQGTRSAEILAQVLKQAPPPLDERVSAAPRDLVAVVDKAMQRDPRRRYRDARGLADDLHRFHLGQLLRQEQLQAVRDVEIEAAFRAETRQKAILPVRVACGILLPMMLLSLVASFFQFKDLDAALRVELNRDRLYYFIGLGLVSLIIAASFSRIGQRRGDLLGVAVLLVFGCLRSIIESFAGPPPPIVPIRVESGMAAYVAVIMFGFLIGTTFFRLSTWQAATTYASFFAWYKLTVYRLGPLQFINAKNFDSLLIAAIIIATIGAWLAERLRRVEFYGRYRLEEANRRLAELERRRQVA